MLKIDRKFSSFFFQFLISYVKIVSNSTQGRQEDNMQFGGRAGLCKLLPKPKILKKKKKIKNGYSIKPNNNNNNEKNAQWLRQKVSYRGRFCLTCVIWGHHGKGCLDGSPKRKVGRISCCRGEEKNSTKYCLMIGSLNQNPTQVVLILKKDNKTMADRKL